MGLNHSEETHQRLVEKVPRCTGREMAEWFRLMNDGPSFLRFDDRVRWLSSEYALAHGHATAIVHEYDLVKGQRRMG
ncbi:MAG TPA: DUF4287 domain-containing protein [Kribbella sp.]|uniref:DUF4287 domain-containing protein n=1 Tax=Kribbella sp. TaxID=1871183 RepID=UPI002D78C1D5|nr:DUF4287 domain-containing protein [Kribbella sp.]HET6295509.1 DUF4287 domain-containing protein [Kribbella sp.]